MANKRKIEAEDYDSAFDDEATRNLKQKRADLVMKNDPQPSTAKSRPDYQSQWVERSKNLPLLALNAYSRHKEMINNYYLYYSGSAKEFKRNRANDKTDMDILRQNHQFVWSNDDDAETWEQRLAKKYYDKLFKEYCIADLSRYKENKVGMRWRMEKEVVQGKGQFFCGSKHCDEEVGLRSWEVNFSYVEHGERKNALVKLRLCPQCSKKLNYHHQRKEVIPRKSSKRKKRSNAGSSSPEESEEGNAKQSESKEDTEAVSKEVEQEIWSNKPSASTTEETVSKDQEFDEYFQDLFL